MIVRQSCISSVLYEGGSTLQKVVPNHLIHIRVAVSYCEDWYIDEVYMSTCTEHWYDAADRLWPAHGTPALLRIYTMYQVRIQYEVTYCSEYHAIKHVTPNVSVRPTRSDIMTHYFRVNALYVTCTGYQYTAVSLLVYQR